MSQDDIFFQSEGDSWFLRNRDSLTKEGGTPKKDLILEMIEKYNLNPRKVLEVGASNGWRLNLIHKKFGSSCVGVEPSLEAINDGKKRYPELELHRGLASELPIKETFDLVIVSFVFHWIGREELLRSVAEIDKVIGDNGFLIISDFAPDVPSKSSYHHLPKNDVFTYKMNYPGIFTSTRFYYPVANFTFGHDNGNLDANIDSYNRGSCVLLKKSLKGFMAE